MKLASMSQLSSFPNGSQDTSRDMQTRCKLHDHVHMHFCFFSPSMEFYLRVHVHVHVRDYAHVTIIRTYLGLHTKINTGQNTNNTHKGLST